MKTALITGGSAGIGKETARALAGKGYAVIIAARDARKGNAVVDAIKAEHPAATVEFVALDLSRFADVRAFASTIRARWNHIDALVLNAGLFTPKLFTSESGHEFMFATTHLGHFLLTHELLPLVRASSAGRIVVTSSAGHFVGKMIDFFSFETPSTSTALLAVPFLNYGRAKLCNLLFVRSLAQRLAGTGIRVNAFHPGAVKTEIWRGTPPLFNRMVFPFMVSEATGAQTQIYLATEPSLSVSGEYWVNKQVARSSTASRDPELARQLWEYSERALGISQFGVPSDNPAARVQDNIAASLIV